MLEIIIFILFNWILKKIVERTRKSHKYTYTYSYIHIRIVIYDVITKLMAMSNINQISQEFIEQQLKNTEKYISVKLKLWIIIYTSMIKTSWKGWTQGINLTTEEKKPKCESKLNLLKCKYTTGIARNISSIFTVTRNSIYDNCWMEFFFSGTIKRSQWTLKGGRLWVSTSYLERYLWEIYNHQIT